MKDSFLSDEEIQKVGFKKIGRNVKISRNTSFYGAEHMEFGDNVRIDDYCVLSGQIKVGSFVHIAAFCGLFGGHGIELNDFCGLSSKVAIYSASDNYSGEYLTGPCIPDEYRDVIVGKVILEKHALVGTGATILPGVTIKEGSVLGSMSLLTKTTQPWRIYAGIPARDIKARKSDLLTAEIKLINNDRDEAID